MTGVLTAASTVMIVRWPSASSLPLGASSGPTKMMISGSAITVATSHSVRKRRQWFGSPAGPGATAAQTTSMKPSM